MRGIIDLCNRAIGPSSSQLQVEMRQVETEIETLRNEVTRLRSENARLMSKDDLGDTSVQELHKLQKKINDNLTSIIEKKDAKFFEEIERSKRKERELCYDNDVLRGEIDKLRRFIPLTQQPSQVGSLEYTLAAAAAAAAAAVAAVPSTSSKQDYISHMDSETALQLRYVIKENHLLLMWHSSLSE